MHDNKPHPLLAQVPLTVSPFVSLPASTTLPYTYKTLPSTLPPSSTGIAAPAGGEDKIPYVVSSSGHAAHPDEIIQSCKALQAYIQKVQDDADKELKAWEDSIAARELAEKRRVAPGWLDSEARILEPEKKNTGTGSQDPAQENLMDADVSRAEASGLQGTPVTLPRGDGDELDRAFGGLGINQTCWLSSVGTCLSRTSRLAIAPKSLQICPICSLSRTTRSVTSTKRRRFQPKSPSSTYRQQSGSASASIKNDPPKIVPKSPRKELHDALLELQKDAANYINISKLQLALRGLEQTPGEETIRVAILGIADGGASLRKSKELLRLLLADPLKTEEEWERVLLDHRPRGKPILIRVGGNGGEEGGYSSQMVQEIHVSSPTIGGYKLEILVLELEVEGMVKGQQLDRFLDSVLVPTMEIPTSNTGRYTPITTPVHRSLLVGQGIRGASEFLSMSSLRTLQEEPFRSWNIVQPAVDFQGGNPDKPGELPIQFIDIGQASSALGSFRKSVNNALDYERNWFASGVPALVEWLKIGKETPDGVLRRPIYYLIESLLHNTEHSIRLESRRQRAARRPGKISSVDVHHLRKGLAEWAEGAHTELRDQLDIAFHGRRWRKLGWWKLFWRVDDVSMIASDILSQRFLTEAEKELIFLAGRIQEAGIFSASNAHSQNWAYKPVQLEKKEFKLGVPPTITDVAIREDTQEGKMKNQPWPLNIPLTRSYLATDTVPALQALAQKLVLQTLVTSSSFSAFAALTYISTLSTGLYEAGAVAAVGIVWSLRRMQGKWETARKFWEGEVREEGRKAVRGVEGVVENVLKVPDEIVPVDPELERAEAVLSEVTEKLKACNSSV
ncbi:hypothetical protein LOCC1_G005418 [Lachnellula occidentalis]|uniref:Mmc1 C-terminal domain-containing protein n=1 Tax=Lachnellula occidentalis TaxID=215460 RepID=A0A8H8RR63_9HELO|nr:hypothetical protein LOCC1_G005418 [Lachnellula occidentalis]